MKTLLVLGLTAFGLGEALTFVFAPLAAMPGAMFCAGFAILPLLLFFGGLVFKIPLGALSVLILGISLVASVRLIALRWRSFAHPVVLLWVALLICTLAFGGAHYSPTRWDELSHWLLMPKQMWVFGKLYDPGFYYREFVVYLPGWTSVLAYVDSALSSSRFDESSLIYAPALLSIGMLGLLYDVIQKTSLLSTWKGSAAAGWLAIVAVFVFKPLELFPSALLIEPVQISSLLIAALAFYLYQERALPGRAGLCLVAAIFAAGYLYKEAFYLIMPALAVTVASQPNVYGSWANRTRVFASSIGLLALCWLIWHGLTRHEPAAFPILLKGNFFDALRVQLHARSYLLPKILGSDNDEIRSLVWPGSLLARAWHLAALMGLILGAKDRRLRSLSLLVAVFSLVYTVCLFWMYLVSFGEYEAQHLSGIFRYLGVPVYVLRVLGPLLLAAILAEKVPAIRLQKVPGAAALVIAIMLALAMEIRAAHGVYDRILGRVTPNSVLIEGQKLNHLLQEQGRAGAKIILIDQGNHQQQVYLARYAALGPKGLLYEIADSTNSWGEVSKNVWMKVIRVEDLRSKFLGVDVLWMIRSDEWMDGVLKPLTNCAPDYAGYFLVKTSGQRAPFTCVRKDF